MVQPNESQTQQEQWSLTITRDFDAPRELVWRAWTEPAHLMQWFCPKDFTVLFAEADLCVGGAWRSGMRDPDGNQYIHHGVYQEIDKPTHLAFTHLWEQNDLEPVSDTLVTVTLTENHGKTTMTFHQVGFVTAETRDSHHGGWSGAFDNLAHHLADVSPEPAVD